MRINRCRQLAHLKACFGTLLQIFRTSRLFLEKTLVDELCEYWFILRAELKNKTELRVRSQKEKFTHL